VHVKFYPSYINICQHVPELSKKKLSISRLLEPAESSRIAVEIKDEVRLYIRASAKQLSVLVSLPLSE
jgi:hypothetical protein